MRESDHKLHPSPGGWADGGARWARRGAAILDVANPGWYREADVMDCPDSFVRPILHRRMKDGGEGGRG